MTTNSVLDYKYSTNNMATDYIQIEKSGMYHIDLEYAVDNDPEVSKIVPRQVVLRGMVERDTAPWMECRWTTRDEVLQGYSYGTYANSCTLNLEAGDRFWVDLEGHGVELDPATHIEAILKCADGYDYLDNQEPAYNTDDLIIEYVDAEGPDAALTKSYFDQVNEEHNKFVMNTGEVTLTSDYQWNAGFIMELGCVNGCNVIKLFHDGEETIRINCHTGEINISPEIEDPYREMWLKFEQAFPQAFGYPAMENVRSEEVEQEPTPSDFDRAMELLR